MPKIEDTNSMMRMKHLLLRTAYSAHAGYSSYVDSERTLNNTTPLKMSRLTQRLLVSVDLEEVKHRRRENLGSWQSNLTDLTNISGYSKITQFHFVTLCL